MGAVFRLNTDGSVDPSFMNSLSDWHVGGVNTFAVQPDERILLASQANLGDGMAVLAFNRYLPTGENDPNFQPPDDLVWAMGVGAIDVCRIIVQPDSRILLGRDYYPILRPPHAGVLRLLPDGGVDASFAPGTGASFSGSRSGVQNLALQPDGRVLVGGRFTNFNGQVRNGLVRLETTGAVDLSFDAGGGPTNELGPCVSQIVLQPDGRILIAGGGIEEWGGVVQSDFTHVNGVPRPGVARLLPNGALDPSFDPGQITGGLIRALALQANGKVIIGGSFTTVQGAPRAGLARLNANGALDVSFDPAPEVYNVVALALQPDGRIMVSDATTGIWRVNGDPVPRLREITREAGGRWRFNLRTQPGERVVIESSTNLTEWRPWSTNTATDCRLTFTNNTQIDHHRFFRAVEVAP